MEEKLKAINDLIKNRKYDQALKKIDDELNEKELNSEKMLLLKAQVYLKLQQLNEAVNVYRSVLERDSNHKEAKEGMQYCLKIMEFKNRDRFEDTNLSMDPWFE